MIAWLASPVARWALVAGAFAAVGAWGWIERVGKQVAQAEAREATREAEGLRKRIQQMEARRAQEDRAARESDPLGRLREEWSRP